MKNLLVLAAFMFFGVTAAHAQAGKACCAKKSASACSKSSTSAAVQSDVQDAAIVQNEDGTYDVKTAEAFFRAQGYETQVDDHGNISGKKVETTGDISNVKACTHSGRVSYTETCGKSGKVLKTENTNLRELKTGESVSNEAKSEGAAKMDGKACCSKKGGDKACCSKKDAGKCEKGAKSEDAK
ncbi:MAG: hypothetical protein R2798_14085 [Chitinophagales bacterium]|nr:hypothetical protein [Bacteroidota bacterium]MCB9043418.1 hypothetical protein [Chitinophagales bacterium]